ncbi:MAG: formate dehydrogenase, partial [Alphaproteobacteria bacterium]
MIRIFVPADSVAVACGVERVLAALRAVAAKAGLPLEVTRTGSRGLHWLEPLIEVERGGVRLGYGPLE